MRQDDGRIWAIALIASLLGNVIIFILVGLASLDSQKMRRAQKVTPPPPPTQATVVISPEMIQKIPAGETPPALAVSPQSRPPQAVRTSEDQRGRRPDTPAFIGERDTEATSDRSPDPNAKPLPSQRGITPRDENDIETTQSDYRDGPLTDPGEPATAATIPAPETPPVPPATAQTASAPPSPEKKPSQEPPSPAVPPLTDLLQGPNPIDIPVPKPKPQQSPPAPEPPEEAPAKVAPDQKPPSPPKPGEPGFRGNQRKTAIRGSISRSGRSALDVADTPLGRYQALISRAVEQEWQRNCVRHRDFITPGFLTVRFFIEPSGKVKSVQFVGEMTTGEVQKGFTLNSIRDAEIPPMPKELRSDFADESLELIFNFYF